LRLAQLALEQARDKYLDLYDYAPVAYFTLDKNGLISDTNLTAVRLLGMEMKSIVTRPFSRLVSRDDQDIYYFHYQQVLETRNRQTCEIKLVKKSGKQFHARLDSIADHDDRGDLSQFRTIVTDVTERKHLEEDLNKSHGELETRVQERTSELEKSNKNLGHRTKDLARSNEDLQRFAHVASHDLQEPLRNVVSCLQMLEQANKGKLGEDSEQLIHFAVDGAKKMKALMMDLLTYSRLATPGRPFEAVDVQEVLDQSLRNLKSLIGEKKTEITYDQMPTVRADSTQLVQVFQNLIGNAVRFGPSKSPKVHVSAQRNSNEWIFSVEDNGIGIEGKYFDRIFIIYQQLNKKNPFQGTGCGLAIVKKIVERHRGRVWVESEVGEGSTFYFTIPQGLDDDRAGQTAPNPIGKSPKGQEKD
jgi:PAS domain S-box-containing protein